MNTTAAEQNGNEGELTKEAIAEMINEAPDAPADPSIMDVSSTTEDEFIIPTLMEHIRNYHQCKLNILANKRFNPGEVERLQNIQNAAFEAVAYAKRFHPRALKEAKSILERQTLQLQEARRR